MQEEKEKKKNYPLVDLSAMSDGILGEVRSGEKPHCN